VQFNPSLNRQVQQAAISGKGAVKADAAQHGRDAANDSKGVADARLVLENLVREEGDEGGRYGEAHDRDDYDVQGTDEATHPRRRYRLQCGRSHRAGAYRSASGGGQIANG
jgi:hypothetical protein